MENYIPKSFRQVLALILCLAMLMSYAVPAGATGTTATDESKGTENSDTVDSQATESGVSGMSDDVEYVSLPITIRDFAADGMLFEFNQTNKNSETYAYMRYNFETGSLSADYDWSSNSSLGYRIRTYAVHGAELPKSYDYWYCVICESDGTIKKVLPYGVGTKAEYATYMTEGCFAVWMWIGSGNGDETDLAAKADYHSFYSMVPEDNRHGCTISYDASTGYMTVTTKYKYITHDDVDYIIGDNDGFTLQRTDESDYVNDLQESSSIPGTNLVSNTTDWDATEPPEPITVTLSSTASQYVYGANLRTDLVTNTLDSDKKPVYTEATVDYLADLLETMLQVPYQITLGSVTYRTSYYLLGTMLYDADNNYVGKNNSPTKDLADVFRDCINGGKGSYAAAKDRFTKGELSVPKDVDTYYEAAYYLLHSLWRDNATEGYSGNDGYGWNTWNYTKINLIQTTNENGEKCYVFNSGYDGTAYEPMSVVNDEYVGSGAIYNTQVETVTPARYPGDDDGEYDGAIVYSNGVVLPNARFDPLGTSGSGASFGYGMNAGTYCELLDTYPDRGEIFYPVTNYHLTLEGHAKFIYYKDANQYFTFTGDDDVYLYINGVRVLDLGGAHSIAKVKINMNEVAQLCKLSDGMTYDFDFYYTERHGTAANFGIETNIQIVDPSMLTTKQGYQNGQSTGYNGYVNPDIPVTYEFALANNGEAAIENLTFSDPTIGVSLKKDAISLNALTSMDDLSVTLYGSDGAVKSSVAAGSLTEDTLKQYLETGLDVGEKIVIYGFSYKISSNEWDCRFTDKNGNGIFDEGDTQLSNWYFFNIIYTTATATGENSSTRELTGTSNWVVQKLQDEKMGSLTITKELDEDADATLQDKVYTMQVLLDGKPVPVGTVYTYTSADGTTEEKTVQTAGQIQLEVGAKIALRAAYGTAFEVRELIAEEDRDTYRATYDAVNAEVTDTGVTGTFTENAAATVTVTNHTISTGRLEVDKYVTEGETANQFTLTLESFVRGELINVANFTPADFILVLDQSASMYAPAGGNADYDNAAIIDTDLSSFVAVDKLSVDKAQHMGYYVAQSTSGREESDALVYDWFVVQYIDGKWYYVRKDKTAMPATVDTANASYTYTGEIGETLVREAPIDTFHYYQSGYGALYDAVTDFVKELHETGVDHRVAVVGFASPCYDAMKYYDGSGVYVDGQYYLYDTEYFKDEGGIYSYINKEGLDSKYNLFDEQIAALPTEGAETVYDKALVSVKDHYNSVLNSLNAVTTNYWHTCPAAGLDMANKILAATPANGRNQTVILFTDGVPTVRLGADYEKGKNWNEADKIDGLYQAHIYWTVAQGKDSALEVAYETKNTYGVNIHTVGTAGAGADTLFLSGVSSNYPNATSYPTYYVDENGEKHSYEDDPDARKPTEEEIKAGMGDPIADPMFSHFASDELTLDDIFEKILQSTTNLDLGAETVLKEIITDYFELDNNSVSDVKVYTAPYDGNGNFGERTELATAEVTLSSSDGSERLDTIEVTGFDYAGEFISETARTGADGNDYYGSKLIVEVKIETRDGFWGGNNVPTNEDGTAIYEKTGDLVDKFPEPQVNVPLSLTVKSDDAVVYYGSDALSGGLLTELTAGGMNVIVGEDGSLTPQAEWMDDFATLTWTGTVAPNGALSTTEPGEYIYSAKLVPNTDGTTNTSAYPSNMAGAQVPMSGISASDSSAVDVLVPVIPFKDSTINQGDTPDASYFNSINLVDEKIRWVLIDDIGNTKTATHGTAPTLSFTYDPDTGDDEVFDEATPVEVTVSAQYGDAAAVDFTGVSYFDWVTCTSGLHDESLIALHQGSVESQNEFWIHVATTPDSSLVTDKYVNATEDPNAFELTLEAYALGQYESITVTKPADIVLVLDHSGSMRTPAGASKVLWSANSETGREGEPYDGTAPTIPAGELNEKLGMHRGYYVAWSTSSNSWFIMEYDKDGYWYSYKVPSTEAIVDTGTNEAGNPNWTEHTLTQRDTLSSSTYANLIYYKSQYGVLYDALLSFVEDLKSSGVDHNVSIVGFAGSETQGARLYVGGDETAIKSYNALYDEDTSDDRRAELFEKSLKNVQNADEYAQLLSGIEAIDTNFSYTCPAAGLKIAADLYESIDNDQEDRDRIVVLFTDGIPNRQIGEDDGIDVDATKQVAIFNEIVEYAYAAKQQGATIYSISTTTLGTGADRTFLHYASSDYPNAKNYTDHGEAIENQQYTKQVENIDDFSVMFDSVTNAISSTTTTLDETAILKEVLTDYFVLNPDDEVDVTVYTAAYDGKGKFGEMEELTTAEVKLSSSEGTDRMDTISVTGFDYHDEYISSVARQVDGKDYYGSKLIVKVRIRTRDGFWGGNNVPTNEGATAIYTPEGTDPTTGEPIPSQPVKEFPEPQVNVPIDVEVVAKDKTIYYDGAIDSSDPSDPDTNEGDELIESVTIGGEEVNIADDGTITPAEDWMDDFAEASWDEDSTKPDSDLSNTEPKDYEYTVVVTPKTDGSTNTQDNPSNIAGNIDGGTVEETPSAETSQEDSSKGHIYILIPEVIFKDSTTEFGTSAADGSTVEGGYDYQGNDYVDTTIVWVDMEGNRIPGNGIPELDANAVEPELTLTYTPDSDDVADGSFITDTKVDVTVSIGKTDITDLVIFDWQDDCTYGEHTDEMDVAEHKGSAESHEFWVHVKLNIVPDTVVIDYGLDVVIDVLDNDPQTKTIAPSLNGIGAKDATSFTSEDAVPGAYGQLSIDGSNVRYSLNISNGMQMNKEEVFKYQAKYTIKGKEILRDSTVTVIPATTIYYEDSFISYSSWSVDGDGNVAELEKSIWQATATASDPDQAQDRPGALTNNDANNIYGYDGEYLTMAGDSMGSSMMATVTPTQFAEAQFTFWGTGFDVISRTAGSTGTILVDVYGAADFAENSYGADILHSYMVDTYYGYKYTKCKVTYLYTNDNGVDWYWKKVDVVVADADDAYTEETLPTTGTNGEKVERIEDAWIADQSAASTLYQVPVMQVENLPYGNYTAVITVWYDETLDHQNTDNKNQYDFYLDAIRIYDPANDGANSEVIEDAYVADGEGWPEYFELRNQIISAEDYNASLSDEIVNGAIFIDNTLVAGGQKYSISDYTNYGPNNELYLAANQAVAFLLNVTDSDLDKIHLAMKSVTGSPVVEYYTVENSSNTNQVSRAINTATDLYYDVTDLNGKLVVIRNTGTGILSITNFKLTYKKAHTDSYENQFITVSKEIGKSALESMTPIVEEEESEPVFAGTNMILGNSLALNIWIKNGALEGEDYYALVTRSYGDGKPDVKIQIPFADWIYSETNKMYCISYDDIAAKEMNDKITIAIYKTDGTKVSETKTESVVDYVTRNIAGWSGELLTTVVDMLNYGAAAQEFFNYDEEHLANADITVYQQYATQTTDAEDIRVEGDNYVGSTLTLESRIVLTMYFENVTRDMKAQITYVDHYGREKSYTVAGSEFIANGNLMGVAIDTLVVADSSQPVTCVILDANDNEVARATDSVVSYAVRMDKPDAIFEMIVKFSASSYAYFH